MLKVEDMTPHEMHALLQRESFGHLGCARDGRPYVVPMHYAYDGKELYFMAFPGVAEMALDISTAPEVQTGTPHLIIRPQGGVSSPGQLSSVATADGEKFMFIPQGAR